MKKVIKKILIFAVTALVLYIVAAPFIGALALCSLESSNELMHTITTEYGDTFNVVNNSFLGAEDYTLRDASDPDEIIMSFNKPPTEVECVYMDDDIRCYSVEGYEFHKTKDSGKWQIGSGAEATAERK